MKNVRSTSTHYQQPAGTGTVEDGCDGTVVLDCTEERRYYYR